MSEAIAFLSFADEQKSERDSAIPATPTRAPPATSARIPCATASSTTPATRINTATAPMIRLGIPHLLSPKGQ